VAVAIAYDHEYTQLHRERHSLTQSKNGSVAIIPPLTDEEVSKITRRSKSTLRRWRRTGYGPKFVRLQREVRYKAADVQNWLDSLPASVAAPDRRL
jgi:predicted DNA-binding transcriptional regulator AlpA